MPDPIAFSGSPLDRAAIERRSPEWVSRQLADPAARFLPMHNLEPLVKLGDTRSLAWARGEMFDDVLPDRQPLLLGLDDGVAHFAVDVSPLPPHGTTPER